MGLIYGPSVKFSAFYDAEGQLDQREAEIQISVAANISTKAQIIETPDEHETEGADISSEGNTSKRLTLWTTDLHAGPIGCQISMFETLNVDVIAKVDHPTCKFHVDSKGKNFCVGPRARGFTRDDNRAYALFPNPNASRMKLYEYYNRDPEFAQADVVFCSHPVANCEIYLPFDKSLLIYNAQRVEFGRDDEFVLWRTSHLGPNRQQRWKHWVYNMKAVTSHADNLIGANNMYDVKHTEYLTGIGVEYIPSWCGDLPDEIEKQVYKPERPEIVLGPFRTNLEYARQDIPTRGWPTKRSLPNALSHALFDELRKIQTSMPNSASFQLIDTKHAFPPDGRYKSPRDFKKFRALLLIPYCPSTMFFFEVYRANVPLLVPTRKLLSRWIAEHRILWETSYGDPARLNDTLHSQLPNPNEFGASSREPWMEFYDVYQTDVFPHILYFNSWEEAAKLSDSTNFAEVSDNMRRHNMAEFHRIRGMWRTVFDRVIANRKEAVPQEERASIPINDALRRQYGLEPLVLPREIPFGWHGWMP